MIYRQTEKVCPILSLRGRGYDGQDLAETLIMHEISHHQPSTVFNVIHSVQFTGQIE